MPDDLSGPRGGHRPRSAPATEESLAADLAALGLRKGDIVIAQGSLRSIGPVAGGVRTVARALRRAVGSEGTLVAYTATPENSDTSSIDQAITGGMGPEELAAYRAAMKPFDPLDTPASPTLGRLSEEIRTTSGALRSGHPQTSFAAVGPAAAGIVARHDLDCHLGEHSPAGALYRAGARTWVFGVPVWYVTALHLAEYRMPDLPRRGYRCVVRNAVGQPEWVGFEAVALFDDHFPDLGEELERSVPMPTGRVGDAQSWLVPIPAAVDAATRWLNGRREAESRKGRSG